eukprot:7166955-Prymnesium_polylepis.1
MALSSTEEALREPAPTQALLPDGSALPEGAVEGYQLLTSYIVPGYEQKLVTMPVRICGLLCKPDLNGLVGTIVSFDVPGQRVGVETDDGTLNVAVRPHNLQLYWRKGDPLPQAKQASARQHAKK